MKREEIQRIEEKINILMGARMVEMERWDNYVNFGFVPSGWDEKKIQEELKTYERISEDFVIAAYCPFRWTYKDRIILASNDMFQPNTSILEENGLGIREGDRVKDFDYNEQGNNRFDEINEQNFRSIFQQTKSFIIKKMTVSKFGDLAIEFDNGYHLEIFINESDPIGCWDFFQPGEINNITIGANEIIEEDIDITKT